MCGIVGFLVRAGHDAQPVDPVRIALDRMRHRGPDDAGLVAFPHESSPIALFPRRRWSEREAATRAQVALGHVRLAILDLTDAGHQPMASADGRFHLTFNGEVYNYIELRDELSQLGYRFNTQTDSEVILAAYQHWGIDCFDRFNGMWGLAIYDRLSSELIICRDRFGVKPIYYAEFPWGWAFASEIKGILPLMGSRPCLNRRKLAHYFATNSATQDEETWFQGIFQLPGGCFLRINSHGLSFRRWYDLQNRIVSPTPLSRDPNICAHRIRELLNDAVRLRLRSDVPVGSCLSGGLDSSTIVMLMSQQLAQARAGPVRTFTYVSSSPSLDESHYARIVIDTARAKPEFVSDEPQRLLDELDRFVQIHDEPVSNPSIYAQWQVMRLARNAGVTVLLDGQGGDENFLGYSPYYALRLFRLFAKMRWKALLQESTQAKRNSALSNKSILSFGLYHAIPLLHRLYRNRRLRTLLIEDCRCDIEFTSEINRENWRSSQITYSPLPHLLKYEDRNSMAFSIETRLPMLDYRLVEFAQTIPEPHLLHEGWSKWILRRAFHEVLPSDIVWRRDKIGFETPIDCVFRYHASKVRELLLDRGRGIDPLIQRDALDRLAANPLFDPRATWMILNTKIWADRFGINV